MILAIRKFKCIVILNRRFAHFPTCSHLERNVIINCSVDCFEVKKKENLSVDETVNSQTFLRKKRRLRHFLCKLLNISQ